MTGRKMPSVVTALQVSRACGMTKKAAEGLLRRHGLLQRPRAGEGAGFPWFAESGRIREVLSWVYADLYTYLVFEADETAPKRAKVSRTAPNRPHP